jgi:hypothetical protein
VKSHLFKPYLFFGPAYKIEKWECYIIWVANVMVTFWWITNFEKLWNGLSEADIASVAAFLIVIVCIFATVYCKNFLLCFCLNLNKSR